MLDSIDLVTLKVFNQLMIERSKSKAARALGYQVSNITYHLDKLIEKTDDILKDNYELIAMYEQDQQDRSHAEINWAGVGERDAKRRDRVQDLLRANEVRTSEDYPQF